MLELYDRSLKRVAFLDNAYGIRIMPELNAVGSIEFNMPFDDRKTSLVEQMMFVRFIKDDGSKSAFYRIAESPQVPGEFDNNFVSFFGEHAIVTLIDKVMFGSYTIGGTGYYTTQAIQFVLEKQVDVYWQLGQCDFSRQFQYNWSQENLLGALFSIPNSFDVPYIFTFDFDTTPWTLNLKSFDENAKPKYYITKRLNHLKMLTKVDSKQLATRLYALGYGEGVNQLDITSVNDGLPYVQAPPELISRYGLVEKVLVDRRFQDPENLKAYAIKMLEQYMDPYVEREIFVSDLYTTGGSADKLPTVGDTIWCQDGNLTLYATSIITYPDNDGDTVIKVANKSRDVAGAMATLSERQRIEQVYAQGATNIFSYSFRDNADEGHGVKESFYIPPESVVINFVRLKYELRRFRSYEKAIEAGGATSSTTKAGGAKLYTSSTTAAMMPTTMNAGAGVKTSSSGGGGTETSSANGSGTTGAKEDFATESNDSYTSGTSSPSTDSNSNATGPSSALSTALSGTGATGGPSTTNTGAKAEDTTGSNNSYTSGTSSPGTSENGSHSHTITNHRHQVTLIPGSSNTVYTTYTQPGSVADGSHSHTVGSHSHSIGAHTHSIPSHSHTLNSHTHAGPSHAHGMAHTHNLGGHSHTVNSHSHTVGPHTHIVPAHYHSLNNHTHNVTIPSHTHTVEISDHAHIVEIPGHSHSVTIENHTHDFTIEDHTHQLEHGIYEEGVGDSIILKVDGEIVDGVIDAYGEIDITTYLSVDGGGKINRGIYHTVEIIPNKLSGVVGSITAQVFIQSRGGGDY